MHPLARIWSVKRFYLYNLSFWIVLCLLQLIQAVSYTTSFGHTFQWVHIIRYPISSCLSYWILSHFLFDIYLGSRQMQRRRFIVLHIAISIAFGLLHKALSYVSGLLLERLLLEQETRTWRELLLLWQHTYTDIIPGIAIYWLVLSILLAIDYWQRLQQESLHSLTLQRQLTEAQLQRMKMQLQPHFLFNALNTIAMMVRRQKAGEAVEMIHGLGEMLRSSLSKSRTQFVTLEEELALVNHYLTIERVRYQDRLQLNMEIQQETKKTLVPNLLLQPVVENAFKHGIAHSLEQAVLRISAYFQQEYLVLEVYNSSDVASQDWILAKSKGIGLRNTTDRLLQLYRGQARFQVNEKENGVLVRIMLPVAGVSKAQSDAKVKRKDETDQNHRSG